MLYHGISCYIYIYHVVSCCINLLFMIHDSLKNKFQQTFMRQPTGTEFQTMFKWTTAGNSASTSLQSSRKWQTKVKQLKLSMPLQWSNFTLFIFLLNKVLPSQTSPEKPKSSHLWENQNSLKTPSSSIISSHLGLSNLPQKVNKGLIEWLDSWKKKLMCDKQW